jgi:hypothetical protein
MADPTSAFWLDWDYDRANTNVNTGTGTRSRYGNYLYQRAGSFRETRDEPRAPSLERLTRLAQHVEYQLNT